jgi:hypothetical protein
VHLQNIIDEMSMEEKNRLMNYSFSELWIMMWGDKTNIQYRHEEALSLKKFELIKNGVVVNNETINLAMLIKQSVTNWTETEWEFPKGRRNNKEKDLVCAIREFEEETGLIVKNTNVIEKHFMDDDVNIVPIFDETMGMRYCVGDFSSVDLNTNTKDTNTKDTSNTETISENDSQLFEEVVSKTKTSYKPTKKNEHSIYVIENMLPIEETFIGTNNKLYKHKYFLAYMENEEHDLSNFQKTEVSKLEWKNLERCIESIRPYCYEKKKLIKNINSFLVEYKIYK